MTASVSYNLSHGDRGFVAALYFGAANQSVRANTLDEVNRVVLDHIDRATRIHVFSVPYEWSIELMGETD